MTTEIPKKLHQFWAGSSLPEEYLGYATKLKALHKKWEYRLWTMKDVEAISNSMYNYPLVQHAKYISPKAPFQFVSDVIRYEILFQHGGVWLDVDMDPNKPMDALNEGTEGWACWEEPGRWANNAALASVPGSPWLSRSIRGLANSVDDHPGAANTIKSGPQYLTPILLAHKVTIYPKDYFYPYLWNELHREVESFPAAYAVHRWNNRRQRGKQK